MVLDGLGNLLQEFDEQLEDFVATMESAFAKKSSIWIVGNGGSASTADHFEIDLLNVREVISHPYTLRAHSMSSNNAVLTAVANDLDFDQVYSVQLKRKAIRGDICFLISASGNSRNLVKAIEVCKDLGILTLALVGFRGENSLARLADKCIQIGLPLGSYAEAENLQLTICHELSRRLKLELYESF